jgi:hypothetical protein
VPLRHSSYPFNRLPDVFDKLAGLTPAAANRILHLAFGLIGSAFVFQLLVVGDVAGRLLDPAFQVLGFAFHFVPVHRKPPSLDHSAPAADETDNEQNDRDDEQHVNNRPDGVDADQAEQPRDEENQRECEQHLDSSLCRHRLKPAGSPCSR